MSRDDRRQTPRKPLHVPALLRVNGLPPLEGRTVDLGMDGACIGVPAHVDANANLSLTLALHDKAGRQKVVTVQARVVYSVLSAEHGFKVGLHFSNVANDARAALEEVLR